MLPRFCLFLLPIHKRSSEKYRAEAKQRSDKKANNWEKETHLKLAEQDEYIRQQLTENWSYRPYWFFNDIIGFVEVGFDGGIYLQGAVYLRMKYLHKGHHSNRPHTTTLIKQQLFQEMELRKRPIYVDKFSNDEIHEVVEEMLSEAKSSIRKRFRSAEIWRPSYKLDCLDLVKACKQVKECGRIGH
jgi:hypothetical protein